MSDNKTEEPGSELVAENSVKLPYDIQGWTKVAMDGADPVRVYFAYDRYKRHIFIYYESDIHNNGYLKQGTQPFETIWLDMCDLIKHENSNVLSFEYQFTGSKYIFFADNNNQPSVGSQMIGFIASCVHSIIFADVQAQQNFNRFISRTTKIVRQQTNQLKKIYDFSQELSAAQHEFAKDAKLLKSKKLNEEEKSVLVQAQALRRRFWQCLQETTETMICTKHLSSLQITNYLKRMESIFTGNGERNISAKDEEIILKFYNKVLDFVSNEKVKEINKLSNKWLQLGKDFGDEQFLKNMDKIHQKFDKKAKKCRKYRNMGIFVFVCFEFAAIYFVAAPIIIGCAVVGACCGGYAIWKEKEARDEIAIANRFALIDIDSDRCVFGNRIVHECLLGIMGLRAELYKMNSCMGEEGSEFIAEILKIQCTEVNKLRLSFEKFNCECDSAIEVLREMYRKAKI